MNNSTKLWIGIFLACTALGYFFDLAGLASLGVLAIAVWGSSLTLFGYLLWWGVYYLGLRRWRPMTVVFTIPLKVVVLALGGLMGCNFAAPAATLPRKTDARLQLEEMLASDQSDRWSGRFIYLPWRDQDRLDRTWELVTSNAHLDPNSQFAAAMILQHGSDPKDFQTAHSLALKANEGGVEDADWLAKATYDRWQLSIGKPQKYGTQSQVTIGLGGISKDEY